MVDPYALTQDELDLVQDLDTNYGQSRGTYRQLLTIIEKQHAALVARDQLVADMRRSLEVAERTAALAERVANLAVKKAEQDGS